MHGVLFTLLYKVCDDCPRGKVSVCLQCYVSINCGPKMLPFLVLLQLLQTLTNLYNI